MTRDRATTDGTRGTAIEVHPVAGHIGAEITGIDLGVVQSAVLRWKVVFFRDQRLDHTGHVEFARRFGEPVVLRRRGSASPEKHPEIETTADRLELGGRFGMEHDEWLRRRRQGGRTA